MNSLSKLVSAFKNSPFLRLNAIFFAGSMFVAFLNYLYYPVLGRMLPTDSFGELQVIVSSLMQMTIVLNVLSMISISILINEKNKQKARATIQELERVSTFVGIGLLIIIALLAEPLRVALKFDSIYPFLAIGAAFVITIPLTFRTAQLKAEKDFASTSVSGAIGSVTKLLFSVILVYFSLKTFGAVIGIVLAQTVALLYTNYRTKKYGYDNTSAKKIARKPDFALLRPHLPYAAFVLFLSLLTTIQVSIDVTIVKYLFDPTTAGNYSAVATVSRIIFFAIGSIIAVLLSSINKNKSMQENTRTLLRSVALALAVGGPVTLVFCFAPTFVMHLLMGTRYDVLTHLLPLLSISTLAISITCLLTTFHIAMHSYKVLIPVAVASVVTFGLVAVSHSTISLVVTNILIGNSLMLAFVIFFTFFAVRRRYH